MNINHLHSQDHSHRRTHRPRLVAALLTTVAVVVALVTFGSAPAGAIHEALTICHSGSGSHYVAIQPDESAINNILLGNGHAGHSHDIIPPFTNSSGSFPGLNWTDEGRIIYHDGRCDGVPEPKTYTASQDYCAVAEVGYTKKTLVGESTTQELANLALKAAAQSVSAGIIPPFGEGLAAFAGLNWTDENAAIYRNGCQPVTPPPPPPLVFNGAQQYCAVATGGGYTPDVLRVQGESQAAVDVALVAAARALTAGIVPPFTSGAETFAGLNWTTENQVIFASGACNGVVPPPVPPPVEPTVEPLVEPTVEPTAVSAPDAGTVTEPTTGEPPVQPVPVSAPQAATVPEAVPAGDGSSQGGTPPWAYGLLLLGMVGLTGSAVAAARRSTR